MTRRMSRLKVGGAQVIIKTNSSSKDVLSLKKLEDTRICFIGLNIIPCFNAGLIRLVGRIKIQWKQHQILYVKIVYKPQKVQAQRGRGAGIN
jgi:hypothetical protein